MLPRSRIIKINNKQRWIWELEAISSNQEDAAKILGIGSTTLTKMCYDAKILWPGRKMQALRSILRSPHLSIEDAYKIKFFLRSAPWHEFKCRGTLEIIKMIQRRVYKQTYKKQNTRSF
jgi:hypothetical protein